MRLPGGARSAHAVGGGMARSGGGSELAPGRCRGCVAGPRDAPVLRHDDARRTATAVRRACWGRGHLACVAAFLAPESFFAVSSLAVSTGAEAAITSSANLRCAASSRSAKS